MVMVLGRSPVKLLSGTEQMESGLGNQTERAHLNLGNHREGALKVGLT